MSLGDGFPESIRVREVGPRDGFQNEPEIIDTAHKIELIDLLSSTGLKRIEITSFVRPDIIPQLSDAHDVLAGIKRPEGVSFSVLIPNNRGLEIALEQGDRFDETNFFMSASETHNMKNVRRTIEDSLSHLEETIPRAHDAGKRCEGVISTSFGCPYEGDVPEGKVFEIAERLIAAGCEEIGFGDTTGMANPVQVRRFFSDAMARFDEVELTAHFHDTRGQGLANVLGALEEGVESFESSFGELGGCVVPVGATGNIASEDLISMVGEMGIDTGVDLEKLLAASARAQQILGRPLGSHVLKAGPVDWHRQ